MKSSPEEPTGTYENPPYIDLADVRAVNPVADLSHVAIDGVLLDDQFAPQDKESEGVSIAEFNHIADAYPIAQKAQYDAMVPQPGRASWWTLNEAYEIDSIGFAAGFSPRSIRKEPFRYRSTVAYRVGENNDNSLLAADFTLRRKKDFTPDFISLGFESGDNLNCIQTTLHSNDVYQVKPKSRLSVKREALDANNGPSKVDEITAKVQRETGLNLAGRDWLEIRFGDKPQFSFFNSRTGMHEAPSSMERTEEITFVFDEKTLSFRYEREGGEVVIAFKDATLVVRELLDLLPIPLENPTDLR